MGRIALIMPYYGELPNYFPLWLQSASYNSQFDFLIFSDIDFCAYKMPENVHVIYMTFDSIKKRIKGILKYRFVLHKPYKLCDYRPLYGLVFQEHLAQYEFWGHCDPDIIWGNLSKFITDEILDQYDRIYNKGHLSMYRNRKDINRAALNRCANSIISSRDAFQHKCAAHFDEAQLFDYLLKQVGVKTYREIDAADIYWRKKKFICIKGAQEEEVAAFLFEDGILTGFLNGGDCPKTNDAMTR